MADRSGCAMGLLWLLGLLVLGPGLCTLYLLGAIGTPKQGEQYATAAVWIAVGTVACCVVWLVIEIVRTRPDND